MRYLTNRDLREARRWCWVGLILSVVGVLLGCTSVPRLGVLVGACGNVVLLIRLGRLAWKD